MIFEIRDPEELRRSVRSEIDRLTLYISQRNLERLVGLSQGYLSRLRTGAGTPSVNLVCTLALLAKDPKGRLSELEQYWKEFEQAAERPSGPGLW